MHSVFCSLMRNPSLWLVPGDRPQMPLEGVQPRVGKAVDSLPLLDRRAVDLFDLPHEQLDEVNVGDDDCKLVDGYMFAALEHIDADDVGADRADARRDEPERSRAVREPNSHDESYVVANRRVPGRGHAQRL